MFGVIKELKELYTSRRKGLEQPISFALITSALSACGGGSQDTSNQTTETKTPSAQLQTLLHSFQEDEFSEGWWYAGQYNEPQLISYFPQAVEVVDIGSDGDLEVIVPLNKGYRTGIDTRHHFSIFENENGVLVYSSEKTSDTPFITGARRVDTLFLERTSSEVFVTVAHDTAIEAETRDDIPWRMGDLSFTNLRTFEDISDELIPSSTLPKSAQTGRDSAVNAHSMAVGDINGDGMDDVLVGEMNSAFILFQTNNSSFDYYTDEFLSSLGWNYREPTLTDATGVLLLDSHLADFDGDGFDDLLLGWGHGTALSRIFFNDKNGKYDLDNSIALPVSVYGADNTLHMKTFSSDLDADGDLDIMILHSRYEPYYGGTYIQYLEQTSENIFEDVTKEKLVDPEEFQDTYGDRLNWSNFWELADLDGDGDDDLVGIGAKDHTPIIYLNDSQGNFTKAELAASNINGQPIAWGDFDQDGMLEFVSWQSGWNDSQGTSSTNSFYLYEYSEIIA